MKFPLTLLLATAVALLTGCASVSSSPAVAQADPEASSAPVQAPAAEPDSARDGADAPELSEDVLYSVLAGELAGQQGDFILAARHYLYAAAVSQDKAIATRAARIAIFSKRKDIAREAANLLARIDPDSADAHELAGLLDISVGDMGRAYFHFQRVVELNATGPAKGLLRVGQRLVKEAKTVSALDVMEQLASDYPDLPEGWYAVGLLASQVGKLDTAEQALARALALREDWTAARVARAQVLTMAERTDEAMALLESGVSEHPRDQTLRMAYARLLVQTGQHEKAIDEFRTMERQQPDNGDVIYALALLALELRQLDEAHAQLLKLTRIEGREDIAAFHLGQLEEVRENYPEALDWYRKVGDGDKRIDARIRSAVVLARMGRLEEARGELASVRGESRELAPRLYLAEGELLRNSGDSQTVFDLYTQAIGEFPANNDLLYARALAAEAIGRTDLLEEDLGKILERDPDHVDALNALGYTLADQTTRYEEAERYIKRALELDPDSPAIIDSMGWLQYRLGNYESSLQYLSRAYELNSDSEIAAHLAEVLWKSGQKEQARAVIEAALEQDPDSHYIRRILDKIE